MERIEITRYRCESHNLKIENRPAPLLLLCYLVYQGLSNQATREEWVCICNEISIQTLHHCLFNCSLLEDWRNNFTFMTIEETLNLEGICSCLMEMERILGISAK